MRWAAIFVFVLALMPSPVVAQVEPTYETINGEQTLGSMAAQLRDAGYDGPWDAQSVITAYTRTTAGAVTPTGVRATVVGGPPATGSPPGSTSGSALAVTPPTTTNSGATTGSAQQPAEEMDRAMAVRSFAALFIIIVLGAFFTIRGGVVMPGGWNTIAEPLIVMTAKPGEIRDGWVRLDLERRTHRYKVVDKDTQIVEKHAVEYQTVDIQPAPGVNKLKNGDFIRLRNNKDGKKKKTIFCQVRGYPRRGSLQGNGRHTISISEHYRVKLGLSEHLEDEKLDASYSRMGRYDFFGRLKAFLDHPDAAIRVATLLGVLGFWLGVFGVALGYLSLAEPVHIWPFQKTAQ